MFFGYILTGLGYTIHFLLNAYFWIVIVGALISWVNPDPYNPIVRFLRSATEPVFYRVRRALPFLRTGGIDFSPVIVIAAIYFLDYALSGFLIAAGARMNVRILP
jgi:YggT family protein